MSLSPTDFVATNVELMVKYVTDSGPEWCTGIVTEVHEYGTDNGHYYVECSIKFDDEDDVLVETLWEFDYQKNNDDAWKFTSNYTPLVTNVLSVANEQFELGLDTETIADTSDEDAVANSDEDYDEDDEDEECEFEYEEHQYVPRPRPSLMNQFIGTLFVFTPLIATMAVVYNAREDIVNALRVQYC